MMQVLLVVADLYEYTLDYYSTGMDSLYAKCY